MKHRSNHGNEHLSEHARAIAEKVVGNNSTTILGNTDFFARRMGWSHRITREALTELVQARILFRSDGFYTNRPPRKPAPHEQTLANLHPVYDTGN